jgi:hypothetical protein
MPETRLINPLLALSLSTKIRTSYIQIFSSYCTVKTSWNRPTRPKFPVIFLGPRGDANSVQNPTLHCMLLMQPSSDFSSKRSLLKAKKNRPSVYLQGQNSTKFSTPFLCCLFPPLQFPSHYLCHFPKFYLATTLPLPEGGATSS